MDNNDEFIHEDEQKSNEPKPAQSQTISPLRGFYWLERSLSEIYVPHFKNWFIAALAFSVITSLIPALLPTASIVIGIMNPLLIAGLLIGAHHVYTKLGTIKPLQMLEGIQHPKIAQLLVYSLIVVVLAFIFVGISMSIIGIDNIESIDMARINAGDELYAKSVIEMLAPSLVWIILLAILFGLATWFAVSLILFSDEKALPAIGHSFVGGLKNFFAVLVFAIVTLICFVVVVLIISLILGMFGSIVTNPIVNLVIDTLFSALVVPIFIGVTYIAYREIFLGDITKSEKSL